MKGSNFFENICFLLSPKIRRSLLDPYSVKRHGSATPRPPLCQVHPAGGGLREGGEGGQQPGGGGEGGRLRLRHRTRMYTEQTAKVVAAAWGGGT